jgi:undecaprenyl-diphosphatase
MDYSIFHALNGLAGRSDWANHLIKGMATYLPVVMGALLVGAWFWPGAGEERAIRERLVVYAVASALIGLALSQVIGHLWFRDRPYVDHHVFLLLTPSGDPSFPSDHAVGAFGLAMPFIFARKRLGWLLFALACLLAMARVAAGTHYPSDVLGGAVVGTVAAAIVWRARSWIEPVLSPCFTFARRIRLA